MTTNKLNGKHKPNRYLDEVDLLAAVDENIRTAVALGVSEQALVEQMRSSLRLALNSNVLQLPKKMYDSSAGP